MSAPGSALLRNPTEFFRPTRRALGDTFVVDAFGYRLFTVFSPAGVRALYALPEHEASFGLATYELVLKRKLPPELLEGRRNFPHTLFGRQDVEDYLDHLEAAMRLQIEELGDRGRLRDLRADAARSVIGSVCPRGPARKPRRRAPRPLDPTVRSPRHQRVVRAAGAGVRDVGNGKRRERAAMHGIEAIIGDILRARRRQGTRVGDYLERICDSFADLPDGERERRGARRDGHPHGSAVEPLRGTGVDAGQPPPAPRAPRRVRMATTHSSNSAPTSRSAWRSARSPCAT